jgi:hypothetical protein
MKKIAIGTLILLSCGIAAILIKAATGPDTFSIRRSIIINAKPEKITAHIIDLRKWTSWSPYEKYDPAMTRTYSGSKAGMGAVYEWKGNSNIGSGRMEITGVVPSRISFKLDFFKPIEGHNTAEFTFEPAGASTRVTWGMSGPNRFIGKIIHVFINMDKMVGKDFEAGLKNLKTIAEK